MRVIETIGLWSFTDQISTGQEVVVLTLAAETYHLSWNKMAIAETIFGQESRDHTIILITNTNESDRTESWIPIYRQYDLADMNRSYARCWFDIASSLTYDSGYSSIQLLLAYISDQYRIFPCSNLVAERRRFLYRIYICYRTCEKQLCWDQSKMIKIMELVYWAPVHPHFCFSPERHARSSKIPGFRAYIPGKKDPIFHGTTLPLHESRILRNYVSNWPMILPGVTCFFFAGVEWSRCNWWAGQVYPALCIVSNILAKSLVI